MKILVVVQMLIAFVLPFIVFFSRSWNWNILWIEIFLVGLAYSLIKISYLTLLSTNSPADRNNFFSINKRFSSKMKGSIDQMGLNAIELQEPTNDELLNQKRRNRKKKLKILNKK